MPRRDTLCAVLAAVGVTIILMPFARIGIDSHHDGLMLKPALDVLSGQTLFRDTFMQYGALTCYLQVLALWLQPSLLALRFLTVGAYAVTLYLLYASWRLILPRSLTVLSCGLFVLFLPCYEKNWLGHFWTLLPWSSVLAMMFQSLGLYALFRVIRDESADRWGLVLGGACASVFWCRQPVGVIMIGTVAVIWLALLGTGWTPVIRSKKAILFAICGGFLAVNLLMLGGIVFSGAGPEWWYQNFIWPRNSFIEVSTQSAFKVFLHPVAGFYLLAILLAAALPSLVASFRRENFLRRYRAAYYLGLAGLLVWQQERVLYTFSLRDGGWTVALPVVVVLQAISSIALGFRGSKPDKATSYYLTAALALGSLVQYYSVPDAWHIFWSLAPTFGLCVYSLWRWSGWSAAMVNLVITATLLPSVYAKIRLAGELLDQPLVTLTAPPVLRGMRVSPEKAGSINQVMRVLDPILRRQPDIPNVMSGNDALWLCFTNNHTNPSPYFVTWPGLADTAANQRRWNYVEQFRPLMFLHQANWPAVNDFYRRARYLPVLYVEEEALEIAVPQELADAMGLKVYGGEAGGGPAKEKPKP